MSFFRSSREKRLWIFASIVVVAIFSTLIIGNPLQALFGDQNVRAVLFSLGLLLVGVTIVVHGVKLKPRSIEFAIWIGFAAVYLMWFLRLGLSERSHLIEFSVLAVFVHKALLERFEEAKKFRAAFMALLITFTVGVIDETFQLFIPSRVFDLEDIVFNGSAALMAITVSMLLNWIRKKFKQRKL